MSLGIKTADGFIPIHSVHVKPTTVAKTITANDTYTAADDGADGYSVVTANVNSVDISPDLMGYTAGDTDLGNGFVFKDLTISGAIAESGTYTINGHEYSGLRLKGRATLCCPVVPWIIPNAEISAKVVIKEWSSSTNRTFTPTYGTEDRWDLSLWTDVYMSYMMYNFYNCTLLDTQNVHQYASQDYYDTSLPRNTIIGTEISIKLRSNGQYITMYVNNVPKAKIPVSTNTLYMGNFSLGGNGQNGNDMVITDLICHVEKEAIS